MREILSVVVRFAGVRISQADLEKRLAVRLERYDIADGYAQLAVGEDWGDVDKILRLHGGSIKALRGEGALEGALLDVAFAFSDNFASITRRIPTSILALAGEIGIDIDVSIYRAVD